MERDSVYPYIVALVLARETTFVNILALVLLCRSNFSLCGFFSFGFKRKHLSRSSCVNRHLMASLTDILCEHFTFIVIVYHIARRCCNFVSGRTFGYPQIFGTCAQTMSVVPYADKLCIVVVILVAVTVPIFHRISLTKFHLKNFFGNL